MTKIDVHLRGKSDQIVIATLNVNGLCSFRQDRRTRSLLRPYPLRFKTLGKLIEVSNIDIINFQEVFTHRQRRLLAKNLPSFGYPAYEPGITGPKGALVTFSRLPIKKVTYKSFYSSSRMANPSGLPRFVLVKSSLKGTLVSHLTHFPIAVVNAHPLANSDWDWSPENRFHPLERAQLGEVSITIRKLRENGLRVVLGADLNVAKNSSLFKEFLAKVDLRDVFDGDSSPTFHAEFVTEGRSPECIDYLLMGKDEILTSQHKLFENTVAIEGEGEIYLTDHCGLCVGLTL